MNLNDGNAGENYIAIIYCDDSHLVSSVWNHQCTATQFWSIVYKTATVKTTWIWRENGLPQQFFFNFFLSKIITVTFFNEAYISVPSHHLKLCHYLSFWFLLRNVVKIFINYVSLFKAIYISNIMRKMSVVFSDLDVSMLWTFIRTAYILHHYGEGRWKLHLCVFTVATWWLNTGHVTCLAKRKATPWSYHIGDVIKLFILWSISLYLSCMKFVLI